MSKLLPALLVSLALGATAASASVLETTTFPDAASVPTYGTFHDRESGFVFVRLPSRWAFVAADAGPATHAVFHDPATGFVFVKLSTGWVFVNQAEGVAQKAPEKAAGQSKA